MLSRDERPGAVRFHCVGCEGTFLGNETIGETYPGILPLIHGARSAVPVEPLACPSCGEAMRRLAVETEGAGVALDFCNRHGVWFDGDELDQVLARVR